MAAIETYPEGSFICAGGAGSGVCQVNKCPETDCVQGDSGGPLTVEEAGVHILAGTVSHGLNTKCAEVIYKSFLECIS